MTVNELKKFLEQCNDADEVIIGANYGNEFWHVNNINKTQVNNMPCVEIKIPV